MTNACTFHQVPLIWTEDNSLGFAIGKPGRMVAAVTDPSMADRIVQLDGQNAEKG